MADMELLWAECPGLVILGAMLCLMTAALAVIAADAGLHPQDGAWEEESTDDL